MSYTGTNSEPGYNLLANSFTAPIDIASFDSADFVNADPTIYILNAGTTNQSNAQEGGYESPGKWVSIPIATVGEFAAQGMPQVISSMQGFWVIASGDGAELNLDYSRLVWGADYSGIRQNKPLRTRNKMSGKEKAPVTAKLKIGISAEEGNDFLYLLESEDYNTAYEAGYDARKIASGGADIFAVEDEDQLAVDATNSIIGTSVGVRTGEETAYTFSFSYVSSEEDLALVDFETGDVIDISEGMEYTFFAEPNSEIIGRFQIVESENAGSPKITTGVEETGSDSKVHKFVKDNQLFILKNGVLYDGMGARVK